MDEIEVETPAFSDQHGTGTAGSVTLPPGEDVSLEIRGTDVGCEPGEDASWLERRLLIDGKPFVVHADDAWC